MTKLYLVVQLSYPILCYGRYPLPVQVTKVNGEYIIALGGSPVEVYFDDFKVEHTKSPVIASQEYYPFGMTYNSYSRESAEAQDYKFKGKEWQEELNVSWLDYGWRMYDPQIARWHYRFKALKSLENYIQH